MDRIVFDVRTKRTTAKRNYGSYISTLRVNGVKLYSMPYSSTATNELINMFFQRNNHSLDRGDGHGYSLIQIKDAPTHQIFTAERE
jgi:hypothetical protein